MPLYDECVAGQRHPWGRSRWGVYVCVWVWRLVRFAPGVKSSSMGKIIWLHPPSLFISVSSGPAQHHLLHWPTVCWVCANRNTTYRPAWETICNIFRFKMSVKCSYSVVMNLHKNTFYKRSQLHKKRYVCVNQILHQSLKSNFTRITKRTYLFTSNSI